MNEKDKIIEEIAELLKNTYHSTPWYYRSWYKIAEIVYEKLLPEDSVVLSKEEYAELINLQRTHAEDLTNAKISYDERIEDFKINYCNHIKNLEKIIDRQSRDLNSQADRILDFKGKINELEEQRDRQAYIAEDLIQEKHKWTEQAGKETAKEFAEMLKEKCKELENKYSHLCKSKKECLMETCRYEGVLAVKRELYEIAKQYGVEVEE